MKTLKTCLVPISKMSKQHINLRLVIMVTMVVEMVIETEVVLVAMVIEVMAVVRIMG